jgi:hypothetical protein
MVLCQDEFRQISMIGTRQRISSLEADGEWLEALALALDYYEGTFTSQEDRKRDPQGRKRDLSKHSEFASPKGEEEEWISKLLLRYSALALDNAPNSSADDSLMSLGNGRARLNLAQSHFQMLVGVCIEYCVTTKRSDLFIRAHFPTISIGGRYGRMFWCPGTVCAQRSIAVHVARHHVLFCGTLQIQQWCGDCGTLFVAHGLDDYGF